MTEKSAVKIKRRVDFHLNQPASGKYLFEGRQIGTKRTTEGDKDRYHNASTFDRTPRPAVLDTAP